MYNAFQKTRLFRILPYKMAIFKPVTLLSWLQKKAMGGLQKNATHPSNSGDFKVVAYQIKKPQRTPNFIQQNASLQTLTLCPF